MQFIAPTEFKRGRLLLLEGMPYIIEEFHHTSTARTKPKVHTRLRNLRTGHRVERVFSETERIPVAELEGRRVQFSYRQADQFVFQDAATFDELNLMAAQIGERHWFLRENEEYKAWFLDGKLLEIELPDSVPLKVEQAAAPQRGGAVAAWKPALLENGLEIMVPLHIAPGEVVRVDTQHRKYLRKETSG
jgi:elongation factor P